MALLYSECLTRLGLSPETASQLTYDDDDIQKLRIHHKAARVDNAHYNHEVVSFTYVLCFLSSSLIDC